VTIIGTEIGPKRVELAHQLVPNGNVLAVLVLSDGSEGATGFSTFEPEIGGKWLELLKEIAPGLSRVAGILDPGFKGFAGVWGAIENIAPRFGIEIKNLPFQAPTDDLESAVARFA
jgi:hypothetical protein